MGMPVRTPRGARVLRVSPGDGAAGWFVRLDTTRRVLVACRVPVGNGNGRGPHVVLACPDEDSLLVNTGRTIERWRFGSARREVLFPRRGAEGSEQ
jgi:hypothetical protein